MAFAKGAGAVPVAASALAGSVARRMTMARVTWAAGGLLAVAATVGAVFAVADDAMKGKARPPDAAKATQPAVGREGGVREGMIDIRGRVVDPGGTAVARAKIFLGPSLPINAVLPPPAPVATSGADGSFRFSVGKKDLGEGRTVAALAEGFGPGWLVVDAAGSARELTLALARDDIPLTGRVLDLQGRPVEGVAVRVVGVLAPPGGDLVAWLRAGDGKSTVEFWPEAHRHSLNFGGPGTLPAATTGADGRFRLAGIGRDRIAVMELRGESVANDFAAGVTRGDAGGPPLRLPAGDGFDGKLQGPDITVTTAPTRPIVGVVRDRDTGKPIRGVKLTANPYIEAVTDDQGRYRLAGLPKSARYGGSIATETPDQPYLKTIREVRDAAGPGPDHARHCPQARGLGGGARHRRRLGPAHRGSDPRVFPESRQPGRRRGRGLHRAEQQRFGRGRIPDRRRRPLPSRRAAGQGPAGRPREGYRTAAPLDPVAAGNVLHAANFQYQMGSYQALVPVDAPAGAASVRLDVVVAAGRVMGGTIVGPDGQPVVGARRTGSRSPASRSTR